MVEQSTHRFTGLLLLAIAGLGAVVIIELSEDIAVAPEVTAAGPAISLPAGRSEPAGFLPAPERQFDEISERPLFFPSRRPFEPAGTEAAAAGDPVAAIVLIGVLLSGGQRAALVQPQGEAAARWVHERQTVAGWLVEEIAADHVRVRADDRVETVKLRADHARPPAREGRERRRNRPPDRRPRPQPPAKARRPPSSGTRGCPAATRTPATNQPPRQTLAVNDR